MSNPLPQLISSKPAQLLQLVLRWRAVLHRKKKWSNECTTSCGRPVLWERGQWVLHDGTPVHPDVFSTEGALMQASKDLNLYGTGLTMEAWSAFDRLLYSELGSYAKVREWQVFQQHRSVRSLLNRLIGWCRDGR